MSDISPTTGEEYYSGTWKDVSNIVRILNIGDGKMSKITQGLINFYQEMVDRQIDDILNEVIWVPVRYFNQVQPDGTTKSIFPGNIRRLARYWSGALLVMSEFAQTSQNTTDLAERYIDDSRRELFKMSQFQSRIQGQEYKSTWAGHTMLPTLMPPTKSEPDY